MTGAYTAIDLSQLPAPAVIESLSYESIFAAMLADLRARDSTFDALVESDPAYKILEVAAYRELILRARVNDAAHAVMLAYAVGSDLEHLAALYGVQRLLLDPGDPDAIPPVPPTYETDAALRRRTQLALEGFSTAGPTGAYLFHALSASGQVLDASVRSDTPGEVTVAVLSTVGQGGASNELLAAVEAAVNADDVRPLTDFVTVESASVKTYTVSATLTLQTGPDAAVVRQSAIDAVTAYTQERHRLGLTVARSGLLAALHRPGVDLATLSQPAADVTCSVSQAAWCTSITVTVP